MLWPTGPACSSHISAPPQIWTERRQFQSHMFTPTFGVIDLSAITTGMGSLETAVIAGAALVIASGLALMAVKFGGKWLVKVFKSFSA